MNVSNFITWLQTQPQDAIVQCVEMDNNGLVAIPKIVDFAPQKHAEVVDMRQNKFYLEAAPEKRRIYGEPFTLIIGNRD